MGELGGRDRHKAEEGMGSVCSNADESAGQAGVENA